MSLYNKYRPQTFEEVVGQNFVVKTILNAIDKKELSHSLILAGLHGCGKTTIARLIGKKLGCHDWDIVEVDAASHNGVDAIRNLVKMSKIPPRAGKHKLYIVDEAHRLSNAAFDAFLKTLEEPDRHVYWIFCSTELPKFPSTIVSRCQVFRLKAIDYMVLFDRLEFICKQEQVPYTERILRLVARKAEGSLRDGISYLEMLINFSNKDLTKPDLLEQLGEVDRLVYLDFMNLILKGDVNKVIIKMHDICQTVGPERFLFGLADYTRDLFMCKSAELKHLLQHIDEKTKSMMSAQYKLFGSMVLFHFLKLINRCDIAYPNAKHKRLHLEFLVVSLVLDSKKALKNK